MPIPPAESDLPTPGDPPADVETQQASAADSLDFRPRRRGLFRRLADRAKAAGERAVHSAIDRMIGPSKSDSSTEATGEALEPKPAESKAEAEKRLGILHGVTLRLRGAADEYIAAKLDEIEARVDVKLDEVEKRLDEKIVELHEQVRKLRDEELRHRLRILKISLIFTVLVAALSLGYKLLVRAMSG